jgi:succinate dehydrogenase/fumarate reductase-like Fe-S protein
MTEIFIFNQRYEIPEGLTILKAFEWAGYHLTRGVGCRGGFCGACGTVYRINGDYRLHYALACQTVIQPGMVLAPIPFFPAQRPAYHLETLEPTGESVLELYPELLRCFGCNTCTKACPQELEVLSYVSAAIRGDLAELADLSFDCIMCGLCVARCPAELVPPNISLLGRRLYGKYLAPPAEHLRQRVDEIQSGAYQADLAELKILSLADLKARYAAREIEA